MTYLLAVLAACANATSSVPQRMAGQRVSQRQNLTLRLIRSLLHEPVWFGRVLAITVGFLLQTAALGSGQLSVVEPILVLELPATLLLATRVFRSRLHCREWGRRWRWRRDWPGCCMPCPRRAGVLRTSGGMAGSPAPASRWHSW